MELSTSQSQQQQQQSQQPPPCLMLTKQNSFEHDESSLGILTPDQMTDFTVALDSSRTPSCENLTGQGNGNPMIYCRFMLKLKKKTSNNKHFLTFS